MKRVKAGAAGETPTALFLCLIELLKEQLQQIVGHERHSAEDGLFCLALAFHGTGEKLDIRFHLRVDHIPLQSWEKTYAGLCVQGFESCDMPSANHVWGAYLRKRGFRRHALPDTCPDCYTVAEFCREHPHGLYVLAISGHVVCVCEGDYYDSWDSGSEIPSFYWEKEDD